MPNIKQYDLEDRTFEYARKCRDFINKLPQNIPNRKYSDQLARSSGSVAANYIEANESLSKKDFVLRAKILRKEAKESRLWLKLCETGENTGLSRDRDGLIQESTELIKILSSIIEKCK